jgi:hypothetical protein
VRCFAQAGIASYRAKPNGSDQAGINQDGPFGMGIRFSKGCILD